MTEREQRGGGNVSRFLGGALSYVLPSPEFSPHPLFFFEDPEAEFPRKVPKKYLPARNSGLAEFPPKFPGILGLFLGFQSLAAQKSHRKIAVTTVAASGLATIPLQKSQGFSLRRPHKNR